MTETCQFCNRPDCAPYYYDGATWNPGHLRRGWNRSADCYEREIASLKEELASESAWAKEYKEKAEKQEIEIATLLKEGRELNEEMKSWGVYFKERLDAWRAWYIDPDQDRTRLQDLGEL